MEHGCVKQDKAEEQSPSTIRVCLHLHHLFCSYTPERLMTCRDQTKGICMKCSSLRESIIRNKWSKWTHTTEHLGHKLTLNFWKPTQDIPTTTETTQPLPFANGFEVHWPWGAKVYFLGKGCGVNTYIKPKWHKASEFSCNSENSVVWRLCRAFSVLREHESPLISGSKPWCHVWRKHWTLSILSIFPTFSQSFANSFSNKINPFAVGKGQ